jgi:hypothetical protein
MIKHTIVTQPTRVGAALVPRSIRVTQVTSGLTGQPGSTLPGSGDRSYRHDQSPAASEWVIDHGLGKWPSVTIIDSAGDEVEGDVTFVNQNRVIVTFSAAFAGSAFVN